MTVSPAKDRSFSQTMQRILRRPRHVTAIVQTLYYVITGFWPVLHLASFLSVTGDKTDLWLVRSFGLIVAVIGLAIGYCTLRPSFLPAARFLGMLSASALVIIDVTIWTTAGVGAVYMIDFAVQAVLLGGWFLPARKLSSDAEKS